MKLGRTPSEMMLELNQHSSGVPNNVAIALEEWGRQLNQPTPHHYNNALQMLYPRLNDLSALTDQRELTLYEGGSRDRILFGEDIDSYQLCDIIPRAEELFPGLEHVPGMWIKALRSYHHSTARQMVAQAIAWRTKLVLRMKGEIIEYLPDGLEGDGDWKVTGKLFTSGDSEGRTVKLAAGEWEAMRLLLPVPDMSES
ncbi:hypothetical protein D3C77_387560 [compost metagenome]